MCSHPRTPGGIQELVWGNHVANRFVMQSLERYIEIERDEPVAHILDWHFDMSEAIFERRLTLDTMGGET